MKHVSLHLDKLAQSSQRLNKALLLLTGLIILLSSTCYWAISRLLEAEQQRVEFHFARVIEIVNEHEAFLRNVAAGYRHNTAPPLRSVQSVSVIQTQRIGNQVLLKAKGFDLSLPFSLAHRSDFSRDYENRALAFGVQLTDYYGGFWASSFYASPQLLVLTPDGGASLAIPASEDTRQHLPLQSSQYLTIVSRMERLRNAQSPMSDSMVRWVRAPLWLYRDHRSIVAMINVNASSALLPSARAQGQLTLAALVDTAQVDEFERVLRLSVYNQFTLVSPEGEVVLGDLGADDPAPLGLSFNREGLRFKMVSSGGEYWTGLYGITYQGFLRYAKWPLVGLAFTIIASIVIGFWINHWYKSRIVFPAQRAQIRLFESEAFNRIMLQYAPVALCVMRRDDHKLLLENQRAVELGVTPAVTQMLEGHQGEQAPGEMCLLVGGCYLQVVVAAARYDGQDVFLCGCNDITRHVDETLMLNQAQRRATAANEAKTVFLATMSHEIRTPLYGVLGNLELLSLTEMSARQRKYLEIIQGSSSVLFQLISNVLDVSKIESGQMALEQQPFNPAQLVEDAVTSFAATAHNKGLEIDAEIDPQTPAQVNGDAGRIRQILHNLLGNAIKFTDSGRIRLRLNVQARSDNSVSLQWQVTDTGVGIPERAIDQLFKPFYQVTAGQDGNGAGLGLSICSRLSKLMGGRMQVVSEPGLGSSFSLIISLPVVDAPRIESQSPLLLSDQHAPCQNVRVLVVEDNPVSQAVLREQLEALGAYPTVACDGQQALQIWHTQPFDLVITDINMPRLNGYELVQTLRKQGVTIPIIGVTANALREEGQRCLAVGMSSWVVKPLSLNMLRQALMSYCQQASSQMEIAVQDKDQEGWIELSSTMRKLMAQTLVADVHQIEQGLVKMDATMVKLRLHSLSGALASVNAQILYTQCQNLEHALHRSPLTASMIQRVRALCSRLSATAHYLAEKHN